jgi:hypothetical protein
MRFPTEYIATGEGAEAYYLANRSHNRR